MGVPLAAMAALLIGTHEKMTRNTFIGTQGQKNYEPFGTFVEKAKGDASGIGWRKNIHMRPNTGATYTFDFYDKVKPQKAPAQKKLIAGYAKYENAGLRYDLEELRQNQGDQERIVDIMKSDRESNNEDIAQKFADDMAGIGPSNAADLNTMLGLLYYARYSKAADGSFVANPTGGFTGQRITWPDGSGVDATMLGQDASLVENERLRNFTITHDGDMDLDTAQKVLLCLRRLKIKPFRNRKGELVTGENSVFMPEAFEDQYIEAVNDGPDDRDGDLFPFTEGTIGGTPIKTVPQWANRAEQPIVVVRDGVLQISYFPDAWFSEGKPTPDPAAPHRIMYIPTMFSAQFLAKKAVREGIAVCHGQW